MHDFVSVSLLSRQLAQLPESCKFEARVRYPYPGWGFGWPGSGLSHLAGKLALGFPKASLPLPLPLVCVCPEVRWPALGPSGVRSRGQVQPR